MTRKTLFSKMIPCLVAAALATPAAAQVAPGANDKAVAQARQALLGWYRGYEFVPTAEHFARLGPGLEGALVALLSDPHNDLLLKARVVSSLINVSTPRTETALLRLLENPAMPSLLRRKAALVLGESYGKRHLGLFVRLFGQARGDVPLREALAQAVRFSGADGLPMRGLMLRVEDEPSVRALLHEDKQLGSPR